jgi:hypothetical protein
MRESIMKQSSADIIQLLQNDQLQKVLDRVCVSLPCILKPYIQKPILEIIRFTNHFGRLASKSRAIFIWY